MNNCYNCGTQRDDSNFFWLVVGDDNWCCAYMALNDYDIPAGYRAIEIECCPDCGAEQ